MFTQDENPKGLHTKYKVQKIVPRSADEIKWDRSLMPAKFKIVDPDPGTEYFVLRLDSKQSSREQLRATRIAVNAYADVIKDVLPELAKDIKTLYPLID